MLFWHKLTSTFFNFADDPCENISCLNGGTCILTPESYNDTSDACICRERFIGRYCDTYLASKNINYTVFNFELSIFNIFRRFPTFNNLHVCLRASMSQSDRESAELVTKCHVIRDCAPSQSASDSFRGQS